MRVAVIISLCTRLLLAHDLNTRCERPNPNDPDEIMDAIGRTVFCQTEKKETQRSGTSSDLGEGFESNNAGNAGDGGRAVVFGSQGVMFVAGKTNPGGGTNDFLVMKYFPDGSLDTSFNTDGIAVINFQGYDEIAHSIALQTDGKVVVGGRIYWDDGVRTASFDFGVVRLTTGGKLDTTFNSTGVRTTDIGAYASSSYSDDFARGIAIDTNGMIVLGGYTRQLVTAKYAEAFTRYKTNGTLDTSFFTNGVRFAGWGGAGQNRGVLAIALDSDGKIIGAGNNHNGSDRDIDVLRLTTSGEYDTAFKTTGIFTFAMNSADETAYAVAIGAANTVVLAGSTNGGSDLDFAIVRLLSSGSFDTSFATTGKKTQAIGGSDEAANAIYLQTDGVNIITAGYTYGSNNDFAAVRLKSNGTLDTTFSNTGKFTKAIGAGEDTTQGVSMNGDGVIILAGRTNVGGGAYDVAIMRLGSDGSLGRSGDLVNSFGAYGVAEFSFSPTAWGHDLIQDTSGKLIVVGDIGTDATAFGRILVNGTFDTSFSTDGKFEDDFLDTPHTVHLQTDGRYVVVGEAASANTRAGSPSFGYYRVNTNGTFDTSFHNDGKRGIQTDTGINSYGYIGSVMPDGSILAVGMGTTAATGREEVHFTRVLQDGSLDTAFFTTGIQASDIFGARQRPENRAILDTPRAGAMGTNGAMFFYAVETSNSFGPLYGRIKSDGSLDADFDSDGFKGSGFFSGEVQHAVGRQIAVDPNGNYIILSLNDWGQTLYRMMSDGSALDTTFYTGGYNAFADGSESIGNSVSITQNNKILTVHSDSLGNAYVARFISNGRLDTTFFTSGRDSIAFSGTSEPSAGNHAVLDNGWICIPGRITNRTNLKIVCYWP